ncbi:MAG: WD40 repeat domain-containing protein, partial [Ktedonobacteraceae bacterium]|nr:WD40 repeat domain-containing protein [Ktedonobacteraceae bacterium]
YSDHYKAILSVSWSPDSTRLVTVGWEGTVQVWQASDGKLLWRFPTLPPASAGLPAAAWSPDGAFIVTTGIAVGSVNATTALWDAARGTLIRKYPDQDFYAQRVAWSPDSMRIATGGVNQSVAVWHANSSQKIWEYQGDIATVYGLAWSPDGTRIASCGTKPIVLFASNGGVRIWDATSGKRVLTYRGHSAQADLKALAWSPNGKFIASGGSDQIVQVWNASTGKQVLTYPGHVNQRPMPDLADPYTIWGLAWSPDSTRIVSSAINGPIHVWKISD